MADGRLKKVMDANIYNVAKYIGTYIGLFLIQLTNSKQKYLDVRKQSNTEEKEGFPEQRELILQTGAAAREKDGLE